MEVVFVLLLKKESALKENISDPRGSKFIPVSVDPFSERAWCTGKQTGRHKKVVPCIYVKWLKICHAYPVPLTLLPLSF